MSQDTYKETRGWQKGQSRIYESNLAERICTVKRQRVENNKFFVGSEYVQMDYAKQYQDEQLPSIWFIKKAVRQAGLQTRKPKKRKKGGSQYLLYPVQAIKGLGSVQQSADFIGKKYIAGQRQSTFFRPVIMHRLSCIKSSRYRLQRLSML